MASKRKLADAGANSSSSALLRSKAPRLRMDGSAAVARAAPRFGFGFGFRGPSAARAADGDAGNQAEEVAAPAVSALVAKRSEAHGRAPLADREGEWTKQEPEARVDAPRSNGRASLKQRPGSGASVRKAAPASGASGLPTRTFTAVRKPSITGTLATGQHPGSGKENNDPSFARGSGAMAAASEAAAACTQVHEVFASHFGREKIDKIQSLLQFRSQVTNKFDVKGVKKEQAIYIRNLKEALKGIVDEVCNRRVFRPCCTVHSHSPQFMLWNTRSNSLRLSRHPWTTRF